MIIYTETDQFGRFDFLIECASDPPTSPTTPSPTEPQSQLTCTNGTVTGEYNDELIEFTVILPFDGDFLFRGLIGSVAGNSLVIRDSSGLVVASDGDLDDPDGAVNGQRIIEGLTAGIYTVELDGASGTFDDFEVELECSTKSPSTEPTVPPTVLMTPSPTNPISTLQCDRNLTGDYNGKLVTVKVYIPFDGDMRFYARIEGDDDETPQILFIRNNSGRIIASDGDLGDDDGVSDGIRTVDNLSAGNYTVEFEFDSDSISTGTFVVGVDCR